MIPSGGATRRKRVPPALPPGGDAAAHPAGLQRFSGPVFIASRSRGRQSPPGARAVVVAEGRSHRALPGGVPRGCPAGTMPLTGRPARSGRAAARWPLPLLRSVRRPRPCLPPRDAPSGAPPLCAMPAVFPAKTPPLAPSPPAVLRRLAGTAFLGGPPPPQPLAVHDGTPAQAPPVTGRRRGMGHWQGAGQGCQDSVLQEIVPDRVKTAAGTQQVSPPPAPFSRHFPRPPWPGRPFEPPARDYGGQRPNRPPARGRRSGLSADLPARRHISAGRDQGARPVARPPGL